MRAEQARGRPSFLLQGHLDRPFGRGACHQNATRAPRKTPLAVGWPFLALSLPLADSGRDRVAVRRPIASLPCHSISRRCLSGRIMQVPPLRALEACHSPPRALMSPHPGSNLGDMLELRRSYVGVRSPRRGAGAPLLGEAESPPRPRSSSLGGGRCRGRRRKPQHLAHEGGRVRCCTDGRARATAHDAGAGGRRRERGPLRALAPRAAATSASRSRTMTSRSGGTATPSCR